MPFDARIHHRRSIRLLRWDYAQPGAYFITLCTFNRALLFGTVEAGQMRLATAGETVAREWRRSREIRAEVELDEFIVMPNHFHAIVFLRRGAGVAGEPQTVRGFKGSPRRSLSALVQGFKASTTRRINLTEGAACSPVWQRNYYERVLRDDGELHRAREYIIDNPRKWSEDVNNPACVGANGIRPQPARPV